MSGIHPDIIAYNERQDLADQPLCLALASEITRQLPEAEGKVWHAHPVWFIDGNPVAGYSKLKGGVRLMFWSGADFDEPMLKAGSGKFKDASIQFSSAGEIDLRALHRWLEKARRIQWDYKNIVKRKGVLERLS